MTRKAYRWLIPWLLAALLTACRPGAPPTAVAPEALPSSATPPTAVARRTTAPTLAPVTPRQTVLFDDDGSPDGTTALMYLLSEPRVSIASISISYGEADPAVYIQHLGRKLDDLGIRGITLGAGPSAPLGGGHEFPEGLREAASDFWGWEMPHPDRTYPVADAAPMMARILRDSSAPVTIFVSGPCTNLAQALRLDPGIREDIAAVFIMGGAVNVPGNLSDLMADPSNTVAEWNIYADPVAAAEVFESGLKIYLVPLDATNQVTATREDVATWWYGKGAPDFAAEIYTSLLTGWGVDQAAIWDVMTAVLMVRPELCGFEPLHLEVITEEGSRSGQTRLVSGVPPNVSVCLQPDALRIRQTLNEVLSASR